MNFIDVDVEKISNLAYVLPFVASLPVQLIFSLTLLFYYFGISLFAGVTMGVIFGTINYNLAKVRAGVQEMILKEKDQRMRHTTEAVDHIKTIKFNSWSRLFIDKILGVRNREVYLVKVSIILDALDSFLARMVTPSLVISTLGVFLSLGGEISIAKAYAGIQIFTYLEMPLRWFPEFVSSFLEFTVSMKRIQNFLLCNELNPDVLSIKDKSLDKTSIDLKISNANFTWGGVKQTKLEVTKEFDQEPLDLTRSDTQTDSFEDPQSSRLNVSDAILLRNLNLEIQKGEFICIIGEIGSGKSSLIRAILGDMIYLDEETVSDCGYDPLLDETRDLICQKSMQHKHIIKLGGSISFVQQTPWIQNKTIRDNILFGLPLDKERYNNTIRACRLEMDLEMLKGGDLIEIGEKGINLSGGQKARISLARAVYADCDIVLMDDPVSALDSGVKQEVFEHVF